MTVHDSIMKYEQPALSELEIGDTIKYYIWNGSHDYTSAARIDGGFLITNYTSSGVNGQHKSQSSSFMPLKAGK